jgi:hypothetical protein
MLDNKKVGMQAHFVRVVSENHDRTNIQELSRPFNQTSQKIGNSAPSQPKTRFGDYQVASREVNIFRKLRLGILLERKDIRIKTALE